MHEYDNRYLWMNLKSIVGSHFANYREAYRGQPAHRARASSTRPCPRCSRWTDTGEATYEVHRNLHQGKVGVLCLSPEEGLGVTDEAMRAKHIEEINRFRDM